MSSIHLRLKRKATTVFLHVDPSESFSSIKERLAAIVNVDAGSIQTVAEDRKRELVDMATVSDQGLRNDDVVFFVLAKETGGWEEVHVDATPNKSAELRTDE